MDCHYSQLKRLRECVGPCPGPVLSWRWLALDSPASSGTERSRATAPAQALHLCHLGWNLPPSSVGTGLVNIPNVIVCCPCHGVNQCRYHCCSPGQNSSWVQTPLHWLGFVLGSVSNLGYLLGLASVTDPWASSKGRFLLRHLLWWPSSISAVKSALPLLFKGQHISSLSSPAHACHRELPLSWIHWTIHREICWPQVPWWSLHSTISMDLWTSLQQEHRGPRQGTCLKSQRSLLEDSWISSCMCGTAGLSQGHCGMGKVSLGHPDWPAVALCFQLCSTVAGGVHCWISEHADTGFYGNTKHCWYYY